MNKYFMQKYQCFKYMRVDKSIYTYIFILFEGVYKRTFFFLKGVFIHTFLNGVCTHTFLDGLHFKTKLVYLHTYTYEYGHIPKCNSMRVHNSGLSIIIYQVSHASMTRYKIQI